MKNEYQEIDRLISEALSVEEAKYYKELEEQSMPQQVAGLFKGKLGWWTLLTSFIMVLMFILTVYTGFRFFSGTDPVVMLKWGAVMFFCALATGMLKLFTWNQMNKNAVLREIKRMELQISYLSKEKI